MDSIVLPFGNSSIKVPLPAGISARPAGEYLPDALPDVPGAIQEVLNRPEGSGPLLDLIPQSGHITVLVSDLTRGRTAASILIPVLEYLERRGAGPDRTTIFIASGMHRGQSVSEIESQLGLSVAGRYHIVMHNARDTASLIEVGTTSRGTKCLFNREVAESSLVVGVGAVSFHYFAGFGGGRKLILPGISGEETIIANHRLSLQDDPAGGLSPGCESGRIDGNPVHEDMLEGASLLPVPVFMVCAVAGVGGKPSFVSAGDIDVAHRRAALRLMECCTLPVRSREKVVLASAGGFPKDINMLQAHKAIRNASLAVEDGGLLLLAAECSEGTGSNSLEETFSRGRVAVPGSVRDRYTLNSQTAMSIHGITERIEVRLHCSLTDQALGRFGFFPWKLEETTSLLIGIQKGDMLTLPQAASFLPVIHSS